MKKALVCGAGGFIGVHLVRKLKKVGYWVRGVDLKKPEFSKTAADEFILCDLSIRGSCEKVLKVRGGFDEGSRQGRCRLYDSQRMRDDV
jgi:nucleoside-diphosphate-sugar epimerase